MSSAELLAHRPHHVDDSAFYDFDLHHDAALLRDPHERVRELLREAPRVFWTPHSGGQWVATAYQDVQHILQESEIFSSIPISPEQRQRMKQAIPPGMPRIPELIPVFVDAPEHTLLRTPLQRAFSPKAIAQLKGEITGLANHLIDSIASLGSCDFMPTVAEQFPVQIFLNMMGLAQDRLTEFRALARGVHEPRGADPFELAMRLRRIADAIQHEILARRAEPKEDLISDLWQAKIGERDITLETMEDYAVTLFLGGLDTVVNAIGFGILHLARNPDLQRQLRADPSLIPDATEELLRRYTFITLVRRVTRDTKLGSCLLKQGDQILLCLPAANLDPKEFSQPEVFDIHRQIKSNLAFGGGPHRCLGAQLARIELQALYGVVLEKLPQLRLDPDKSVQFQTGHNLGVASLPVRWN